MPRASARRASCQLAISERSSKAAARLGAPIPMGPPKSGINPAARQATARAGAVRSTPNSFAGARAVDSLRQFQLDAVLVFHFAGDFGRRLLHHGPDCLALVCVLSDD